jgi:hypothetical protein
MMKVLGKALTASYLGQVVWGSVVPHNRYSTDSTQVFPGILSISRHLDITIEIIIVYFADLTI